MAAAVLAALRRTVRGEGPDAPDLWTLVEGAGRYSLASGRTIFEGWSSLGRWTHVYFVPYIVIWGFVYGAAAMAGTLAMPSILRAQDRSLKVGVYGGYFKDSFDANIFPVFTEETGITVNRIEADDLVGRHAAVAAPNPQVLGRLLLLKTGEKAWATLFDVVRPFSIFVK